MKIKLIAHCDDYYDCGKKYVGILREDAEQYACSVSIANTDWGVFDNKGGPFSRPAMRCVPLARTNTHTKSMYVSPAWYTLEQAK